MKKKIAKKLSTKTKRSHSESIVYIRYISLGLVTIAIVLAGKGWVDATRQVHVLGVQTGSVLLADHGSDDSGEGSSGGGGSSGSGGGGSNSGGGNGSGGGSSSGSGGGNSGSGDHGGSNSGGGSSGSGNSSSVSDSSQVDCVGPDGTHFTTTFKSCSDFNNGWHHPNFSFTPLSNPQVQQPQKPEQEIKQVVPETEVKQPETNQETVGKLEVKTEDGKSEVKLEQNGTKVKIEKEDGKLKVKAEKADGTEIELETEDALGALNNELEAKGVKVATTDAHTLTITKGETEAETELPIGVDPTTHELTVTTPAGTKTVSILPDRAVENLLNEKVLNSIESKTSLQNGKTTQKATLTEVNDEPVFAVKGLSQKKLFGLIPVAFAKTGFVSATTGQVTKTDETLINRILEALSF